MLKSLFTIYLISCIFTLTNAQNFENLKVGGYKYAFEFKNNTPSINNQFLIEERTLEEKINSGGNDYKILSIENKVPLGEIKKEFFGIFDGENFYINAFPYTGYDWYAKAETVGKFIYFKGVPPLNKKVQEKIGFKKTSYTFAFAMLGGAIGGGIANIIEETENAKERIPILLNVESGEAIYLTKDRLYTLISNYPDLKQEYFAAYEDNEEVIIKFINKLNKKDKNLSLSPRDIDEQIQSGLENQLYELMDNLYKTEEDSSFQLYYNKILKLTIHPEFEKVELYHEEYSNGNLKVIGLNAKHKLGESGDDIYSNNNYYNKIGTWRYFYENGQLKNLIDYNLNEKKDGRYLEFDSDGNLKKEKNYNIGKKIK